MLLLGRSTESSDTSHEEKKEENQEVEEDEEEEKLTEEQIQAAMVGMTTAQKRLFNIRMKINQGRKANKKEVRVIDIYLFIFYFLFYQ